MTQSAGAKNTPPLPASEEDVLQQSETSQVSQHQWDTRRVLSLCVDLCLLATCYSAAQNILQDWYLPVL